MTAYGYARVSTNGQDLAAQEAELMAAGAAKVFTEKVSGAKTDRAELAKVIRRLELGDVLVVTRLDRLARSTRDLLNVLATIGEREALRGSNPGIRVPVRVPRHGPRPTAAGLVCSHPTSNSGAAGATDCRSLPVGQGTN